MNEQAKAQVEAFIDVAKVRYGLSDDDIAGMFPMATTIVHTTGTGVSNVVGITW